MADVTGLSELQTAVAALNGRLREQLPQIAVSAADVVFSEIRSRMPVDTGDMAANLDEATDGRQDTATVTVAVVHSGRGGDEHKAIFQEYGTSKMPAHPFFRPGVEAARPQVAAQLTQDILKVIEQ
jgi:HK97 gp10 family phage protein